MDGRMRISGRGDANRNRYLLVDFNEASKDFDNFLSDVVVERHRLGLQVILSARGEHLNQAPRTHEGDRLGEGGNRRRQVLEP